MEMMTLREIHERFGVPRRAIQGYEQKKLVFAGGKNGNGHLLYDSAAVERICRIRQYQTFGFRLDEIAGLLTAAPDELKTALEQRRSALEAELKGRETAILEITALIDAL